MPALWEPHTSIEIAGDLEILAALNESLLLDLLVVLSLKVRLCWAPTSSFTLMYGRSETALRVQGTKFFRLHFFDLERGLRQSHSMRFRNGLMRDLPVHDIHSTHERRLFLARLRQPVIRHQLDVAIRHVR
jgi:hypothetical protein